MISDALLLDFERMIIPALYDTLYMVSISSIFSVVFGLIIGIILYVTKKGNILENNLINSVLGTIINIGRSIPFVILMIAVFPLSKLIVGTTIGSTASIVPLTVASIPFVARMIEMALGEIEHGVIEASISMGASEFEIIFKVLLPETISGIISAITTTIISIIGYSAMAGTIGGGGLGNVAIAYGYQRFRNDLLIVSIILMVILVQIVQTIGNYLAKKYNKK
ncbi:MAG: methionine ABC transporter permease [bacterium]